MAHELDIPEFLRISAKRRAEGWRKWDARNGPEKVSPVAERRQEMMAERKRVAIAKLHVRLQRAAARKTGALRQMPLQGRDAMRVITKGDE